jgi:hypothetical protein
MAGADGGQSIPLPTIAFGFGLNDAITRSHPTLSRLEVALHN